MSDDGYKYSANGSARGAVKNKYIWTKVKIKNGVRYIAILCVILGFWHMFAVLIDLPMSSTWLSIAAEFSSLLNQHTLTGNFILAIFGAIYVWFGP